MKKLIKPLIILMSISALLIVLNVRNKVEKKQNYSSTTKKEATILDDDNLVYSGNILSQDDGDYNIDVTFTSDKCIKEIERTDTGETVSQNEESKENRSLTQNTTLKKDTSYQYKVTMADGSEYYKNFEIENAEISLGDPQKESDGTFSFPNFKIINPMNEKLSNVVIQFASGIKSGDTITMGDYDNIEVKNSGTMSILQTENVATTEIEKAIKEKLRINFTGSDEREVSVKFSVTDSVLEKALSYYSETNHYYEFVPSYDIDWDTAKDEAEKRSYFGEQGYLATISSEGEQKFAASLINGSGWIGGTCDYNYILDSNGNKIYSNQNQAIGNWYWVTGPEKGQRLTYTNWASGQPDNAGNEYCLHMYGPDRGCVWNDYNIKHNGSLGYNRYGHIAGYIVEYGGMPEDQSNLKESYSEVVDINTTGKISKEYVNASLISKNPTKYYGKEIIGYTSKNNGVNKWQILGSDENNIYIISSNYVEKTNLPEGFEGTGAKVYFGDSLVNNYSGFDTISEDLKKLNEKYSKSNDSKNDKNDKQVAALMDQNLWSSFKDVNHAKDVIGSPTIEMMTKFYNDVHSSDNKNTEMTEGSGYKMSKDGTNFFTEISSMFKNDYDETFVISSQSNANAMWLASPSANKSTHMLYVGHDGSVGDNGIDYKTIGLRPVAILNSDIILKVKLDGSLRIDDSKNAKKAIESLDNN